ncbi:hypothetical protein SUGI_0977760 [Cryptomeria japonica]|nr:hypothetical protein SUGI_0977760 [Cryptomeria japonica]
MSNLQERLSNFNGSGRADPTIDGHFRKHLSALCSRHADPVVALDNGSASSFDSHYYRNLESGKGLLYVDQALMAAPLTRSIVDLYASNQQLFYRDFSLAMVKLFNLNVLTGKQGQIRKECSKLVNSSGRSRKPVTGKLKLLCKLCFLKNARSAPPWRMTLGICLSALVCVSYCTWCQQAQAMVLGARHSVVMAICRYNTIHLAAWQREIHTKIRSFGAKGFSAKEMESSVPLFPGKTVKVGEH